MKFKPGFPKQNQFSIRRIFSPARRTLVEETSKLRLSRIAFYDYQHHKHQGLDPLIRSVSRVTAVRVNASSVFQLFSFLVVCSGMISKGFGFCGILCKCESQFRLYSSIFSSMLVIRSSRRMWSVCFVVIKGVACQRSQ